MTNEEKCTYIKQILGVEFTFVYEDGDTIKAYAKAFDPKVGFSCYTLATKTERDGWVGGRPETTLEDGTWCVCGIDFSKILDNKELYDRVLNTAFTEAVAIRETGRIVVPETARVGSPSCSF